MMTFRFAKCTVAVGVIGLAAVLPSDAQAASATATATVTINAAISMAKTVDMSFGTIGTTGTAGTVVLGTDGSRTCTNVDCLAGSPGAAASFNVTGDNNATYSITLPGTAFLTGPGPPMTANAFTSSPTATGTLSGAGAETLLVGATLAVGTVGVQTPGTYTSTDFTVTVDYN
jgi:hypothetical protein